MKFSIVRLAVVALFSAATFLPLQADTLRIMPLGDSITQSDPGYRIPLFNMLTKGGYKVEFVGSFQGDPKSVAPHHEGHGGFTIGPGKSKADAWSNGKGNLYDNIDTWLAVHPDYVLLLIGTNEYWNITKEQQPDYDPNKQGADKLGALLDKIHQASPESKIVVSSILPVEWDRQNYAQPINSAIPGLVATRPYATFADLNKKAGFTDGDWSPDRLHPSDAGYQKLAKAWYDSLVPVLPPPANAPN